MMDGLPFRVRPGYAMGSLAAGAFNTVPGLLLLPYLTDTLGVGAGLAGVLILLPKAWDVVLNPVVGRISDRTRSRWGARRPYLLVGGLALAVMFWAMFAGPFGGGAPGAVFVTVAFWLAATAFGFFQVPYVAMPAEITASQDERTRLMSWRIAVLAVAILVSGAVAPLVVTGTGGGITGHRAMGGFMAVVIAIGAVGAFAGTRSAPLGTVTEAEPSLRAQLAVVRRNRPFLILLTVFVVQTIGIATMLAGVKYLSDQVLNRPEQGPTVVFACFIGPALLVMPLWNRVGAIWGKAKALGIATVIMTAGTLAMTVTWSAPPEAGYAITAIVGIGYAGQQVYALSMLPDCIAADDRRTGRRQAGVFTGLWTAGETLGLALGPGVFGLVLSIAGYVSSESGTAAAQTDTVRAAILAGFTIIPALLLGPVALLLRRYRLADWDSVDR